MTGTAVCFQQKN